MAITEERRLRQLAYNAKYRAANKDKIYAVQRLWVEKNRERVREYLRKWKLATPANKEAVKQYGREWYKRNRDKRLARCKAYKLENPEAVKRRQREYDARPDRVAKRYAVTNKYRKAHPEITRAYNARRKAKIRGSKKFSRLANAIIRRWKSEASFTCYYCRTTYPTARLHVDHITPLAAGGSHTEDNIARSCNVCNQKKRDNPVSALRFLPQTMLSL